jgi:hypothetical protein
MSKRTELVEQLAMENPEALLADGFEEAFLGICRRSGREALAAYSYEKCILILMERDEMSHTEAVEFFEFNVIGAWLGEGTSVFVQTEPL